MVKHHGVQHLGVIIDGNRRWAKARGLPTLAGHQRGYELVKKFGEWCLDRGISIMTVYAFSSENWKRSKKEVTYLMRLMEQALLHDVDELLAKGIRLRVIGRREELSPKLRKLIAAAERRTSANVRSTLQLAINYGGRADIVEAVKKIIVSGVRPGAVTEATIADALSTAGQPEPELILRTSGEMRLSNFLSWESAYSELLFIKKNWPDFTERDLDAALEEYSRRHRRFGV